MSDTFDTSAAACATRGIASVCAIAALIASAACNQPKPTSANAAGGPQVSATVVTIRTMTAPSNRSFRHSIVVAGGKVRIGNEVDRWRLFDFNGSRVVFVDDLAKTWRSASFDSLVQARKQRLADTSPSYLPIASLKKTSVTARIVGISGDEYLLAMGGYRRRLVIGQPPSLPPTLFAMMTASEDDSPLSPTMRDAIVPILDLRGFPLSDHSELTWDQGKPLVIDRRVEKIEEKNVPASWLEIPGDYRDVTPVPAAPGARRPAASSSPRDRKTPGAG